MQYTAEQTELEINVVFLGGIGIMLMMGCLAVFSIFGFLISSLSPLGRKQPQIPKHCGAFLYHVMYPRNLKTLRTFLLEGIVSATFSIALME